MGRGDEYQVMNIRDLGDFQRLLQLCAGATGQLLNMNSMAVDLGVDMKTVKNWLSVLQEM